MADLLGLELNKLKRVFYRIRKWAVRDVLDGKTGKDGLDSRLLP